MAAETEMVWILRGLLRNKLVYSMPSASRTSQNERGLINLRHRTNPLRFERGVTK
jgi:hypothetical protein